MDAYYDKKLKNLYAAFMKNSQKMDLYYDNKGMKI